MVYASIGPPFHLARGRYVMKLKIFFVLDTIYIRTK